MASTNKTAHYDLSQFLATDKPAWLTDYNSDMSKVDTGIFEAKTAADGASASATTAMDAATAAQTAAQNAETAATAASTSAADAKADAATALSTATAAQTTANTAQSTAQNAQTSATAAATAAANAQQTATNAETIANNAYSSSTFKFQEFKASSPINYKCGVSWNKSLIILDYYFTASTAVSANGTLFSVNLPEVNIPDISRTSEIVVLNGQSPERTSIKYQWVNASKTLSIITIGEMPFARYGTPTCITIGGN